MGFFGPDRQFSTPGRRRQQMSDYDAIYGRTGNQAGRATSGYLSRAERFDPSQAVTQYGQGFMDEAQEALGESFEGLVGESVGAGRQRTGFFQRDAGRMFQDFNRRVSNAIAAQSLNAANLDLQNIQGMGAFGTDIAGQQIDLLAGAMDRATAEENARTSPWEALATVGGAAAGFGIGGPAGAAAGASAGRSATDTSPGSYSHLYG